MPVTLPRQPRTRVAVNRAKAKRGSETVCHAALHRSVHVRRPTVGVLATMRAGNHTAGSWLGKLFPHCRTSTTPDRSSLHEPHDWKCKSKTARSSPDSVFSM